MSDEFIRQRVARKRKRNSVARKLQEGRTGVYRPKTIPNKKRYEKKDLMQEIEYGIQAAKTRT